MIQKLLKARRFPIRPHIFFILLICGILSCPVPTHAQAQPQSPLSGKNVLILHALESSTPLSLETNTGLLETLRIGGIPGANLFFESMDLRRNPGPELRKLLVEQMRLKWSHRKADMIITVYPEALEFVLNDCRDVFPHVPIIALHLPRDFMIEETGRRIIGHFPTYDITGTIDNALKLVPGTTRVYVVSGAHKVDKWLEDQARLASKKWERVEFLYLSHMTIEDMLATVSKAPPGSVILYLALTQDVAGKSHTGLGLAHELSQVSTVPVFGLFESALGLGVTGGTLISWNLIGKRAGQLVIDILKGVKTLDDVPPVLDVPSVPMFDWRQLRHWKLSESALPKGSILLNKEPTPWDFRYYIIGGLAFVIAQTFLLAGLLIQKRRKRSVEDSLRQKTEELDQFFNLSLELLCIANTDGYFLRLNPSWERILGHTREELMGKRFFDFIHLEDLDRTHKAVSILASQQKPLHFGNRYRCKDGTYRWLEWTATPAGDLIYAAAHDVTERLKEEIEARQRRDELAHVTRIAMMGELTTALAHEINQPLTAILSNAEAAQRFLSQASPDISEVRQILEDIVRDDRRANDVVRKVRALVKKEKVRAEPLDLNEVIGVVVDLIRADSLLLGLSIDTDLSPRLAAIHGDGVQLQQVILNLILNSAAAMRNSPSGQRKIIVRTAMLDGRTVKTFVKDFGTGIDEHHIDRLFEPFYTTKPEGLGMGLSISQTIIKAHGGTMEAWNNREGGATFAFTLLAHQGDSA
jgi:PAS domain S-box-containing protein